MFLLVFVVAGLAVGLLRGGSLLGLAALQLRLAWLIPLGIALQVAAFSGVLPAVPGLGNPEPYLHVLSYLALLAGIAANLHLGPLRVLAVGAGTNFAAIVANGGYMPASPRALQVAGLVERFEAAAAEGRLRNSTLLTEDTWLPLLGDVFAIPAGLPLATVFSLGDVLIGAGALMLVVQAMGPETQGSHRTIYRRRVQNSHPGAISGALEAAGGMFDGLFGAAADVGGRLRVAAWGRAPDGEGAAVASEGQPSLVQCPRCQTWVGCENGRNSERGLYKDRAPDPAASPAGHYLGVEMSPAQASRSVRQVPALAAERSGLLREYWGRTVGAGCPNCAALLPTNAKFCPECGTKMRAPGHCAACRAELAPRAKFCHECGKQVG